MVDEYRTEEEQIEAIRRWWDENGRSTLITIVLAIAAVFGWNQWQSGQKVSHETASAQYQELLASIPQNGEQSEAQFTTTGHLADELQSNNARSTYAHFAALQMAKLYVERDDLAQAREQLQWVLDNRAPDPAISALARLRLARVIFAETGAQAALDSINNVETGPYRAAYAELRGDLFDELGELAKAEQAYSQARESLGAGPSSQANPLLELKYKSVVRRLEASSVATAEPETQNQDAAAEQLDADEAETSASET